MIELDKVNLHKEIDLIQSCINRMASNSFFLKGWTISIIAVVLALFKENVNFIFLSIILLVPLVSFWYLDAFFLYTEKLYRKMYEWVIINRPKGNSNHMYDLKPQRFKNLLVDKETGKKISIWTVMWSDTLKIFYFIPIAFLALAFLISLFVTFWG